MTRHDIKARVIIEMHGGTIQGIYIDHPDIELTDVVFTEDPKYLEDSGDCVEIAAGPLEEQGVYTHHVEIKGGAWPELFDPVFAAAEKRAHARSHS